MDARTYLSPYQIEIVVYHDPCMDGLTSAAVALDALGAKIALVPYDHRDHSVAESMLMKLETAKNVLFIDCTPSHPILEQLREKGHRVMVLDHHDNIAKEYEGVEGYFFTKEKAGCMLAWEYFHGDKPMPPLIRCIGGRDLGDFRTPENRYVGYALVQNRPNIHRLCGMIHEDIGELIKRGRAIEVEVDHRKSELKSETFGAMIDGILYSVQVAKVPDYMYINELAESLFRWDTDFVLMYYVMEDERLKLSLRTNKEGVNVAAIAKTIGGNGHTQAAGATVDALPWDMFSLMTVIDGT